MQWHLPQMYIESLLLVIFMGPISLTLLAQPSLPPGFGLEVMYENLNPVGMATGHHGEIWLVEKAGRVLVIDEEGDLLPEPFIQLDVDDYNERGLLGIALHPDMDNHPYVYLHYSVRDQNHNRVSRFLANGTVAVPGSEEILLEIDPLSGAIHNGGAMQFGLDGKLYIATGEGANSPSSQDLNSLLGKILRINDDGSIPNDNPFYQELSGKYRSIYAYGLRNPFSMAIDHDSGRIFVCDVGQGDFEEINEIFSGANYGWPLEEGKWEQQGSPPADYEDPFYQYSRDEGCAVVGATFYHTEQESFPEEYHGKFFFADYCEGYIHLLDPVTGEMEQVFGTGMERPVAFAINEETGDLYLLTRAGIGGGSPQDNTSTMEGTLQRIFYQGSGSPIVSSDPRSTLLPVGEDAQFKISALGQGTLQYQWQINGTDIEGARQAELLFPNVQLADDGSEFRCIVENSEGRDTSKTAILQVTANRRPQVIIEQPISGRTFAAGDTIFFQGRAEDPESGLIQSEQLCWRIDLHHNDHSHPAMSPICGIEEGRFVIPTVTETDSNIWFRIYLQATDEGGLQNSTYVEVYPSYHRVSISGPEGLRINIDGKIRALPFEFASVKGLQHIIQAPFTQQVADSLFIFEEWGNGSQERLRKFFAVEGHLEHSLRYRSFEFGKGEGLRGRYYIGNDLAEENFVFEQVDTTIDFEWDTGTPMPDNRVDFFSIRWTGEIQAVLSEEYTFYTWSDDGIRLWVDEVLLIDQWVPQAATEHSAQFQMEGGKKYPIRIEYFENAGGAVAGLRWSSEHTVKDVVPKWQLFPTIIEPARLQGIVWLEDELNDHYDAFEKPLGQVSVLLITADASQLIATTQTDNEGKFEFNEIPEGIYRLQFVPSSAHRGLLAHGSLNGEGLSPEIAVKPGQSQQFDASYIDPRFLGGLGLSSVRVFPNPGKDQLKLRILASYDDQMTMEVFDMAGQLLKQQEQQVERGLNSVAIDMHTFQQGVYGVRVRTGDGTVTKKWIKTR